MQLERTRMHGGRAQPALAKHPEKALACFMSRVPGRVVLPASSRLTLAATKDPESPPCNAALGTRSFNIQVLIAIVLGVLVGYYYPTPAPP